MDRAHLWTGLARCCMSPEMTSVFREFHDGIKAHVGMDDGENSEPFGVSKGWVFSPLLFNIFAAVLSVTLQSSSADTGILASRRRCTAGGGGRRKSPKVQRAVMSVGTTVRWRFWYCFTVITRLEEDEYCN